MRIRYWFILLVALFFNSKAANTSPFYSQSIYADQLDDGLFQQSLADLKFYLQKATNKDFTTQLFDKQINKGIYILLNQPGIISTTLFERLKKGSVEDFVLMGDKEKLVVVANHPKGLSRAIYTYLDWLGVKWYFPGDEWTSVPSLSQITFSKTQYISPSFLIRDFFGTGGIVPIKAVDPNGSLSGKWEEWKRRNRLGGQLVLAGHYGEAFNLKYRKELEAHPEYLALVSGKRQWSTTAKWNISNKAFRDLFIADRIEELKKKLQQVKYSNEITTISVEPADGYGDCECEDCKRLGSVSDRYFFLANEAAKAVAKISPFAYVNLYGYNTHAAPPAFTLEPNVIVQIIPYAFQKISTPEQLITDWRKKCQNLFLYDYYGIPDWHYDTPLTAGWSPAGLVNKIKDWKRFAIKGFMLESSYSIGSTGLGLYFMSRLGWNMNEQVNPIQNGFYKNMFGQAASQVRAFYEKINGSFQGAADLPYLLNQLEQASIISKNDKVNERIQLLQAYLHYLIVYYQWQAATPESRDKTWEELVSYTWQIYPTAIVHTTRLAQLFNTKAPNNTIRNEWQLQGAATNKLKDIRSITSNDMSETFIKDRQSYPLLEDFVYESKGRTENFIVKPGAAGNSQEMMLLDIPETYVRASKDGYFTFSIKVNDGSQNNQQQTATIQCLDTPSNKKVFEQSVSIDRNWKQLQIKLPASKSFRLVVKNSNWIRMQFQLDQWVSFKNIPVHAVMGRLWFYVPSDVSYIYFSNNNNQQPSFQDAAGKPLKIDAVNKQHLYRIKVGASTGDRWFSINESQYKFLQFYAIPGLFFLHPGFIVRQGSK
ncbi:DUF4838 domain-containing protein [Flavisolibacter tropicus]|uniref:Alpha glucuronidase N-terminal domain-containing protein n=1 Tax=Flavisolibacter tropicus TaxID=1492898 RepID=A0A172U020_9BACT|nr:DUF4838 domain-containing protein [Flavisolibacter tropicus]ANE52464.1 hypothetical protein SY85_20260 [Flavisolibacter tropicus]